MPQNIIAGYHAEQRVFIAEKVPEKWSHSLLPFVFFPFTAWINWSSLLNRELPPPLSCQPDQVALDARCRGGRELILHIITK